jgi:FecR protein
MPCPSIFFVIRLSIGFLIHAFDIGEQIMKTIVCITLFTAVFLAGFKPCLARSESFGIVKSVSGDVVITSAQTTIKAVPNMKIVRGDSIKTGDKSSAGLIFEDDTVVALGPNSEMTVDSLMFKPIDHELSFVVKLLKGTFSFLTGQIAKLAPEKVKLETPDATLGVRGTKLIVEIQ